MRKQQELQDMDFVRDTLCGAARQLADGCSFSELRSGLQSSLAQGLAGLPPLVLQALSTQLALKVWNETPLPELGFRCSAPMAAERQQPCPCGSGRKYKHCCGGLLQPSFPVPRVMLLAGVLDGASPHQLAQMPLGSLRTQLVEELADFWIAEDLPLSAADLLTATLAQHAELDARHAQMASLLLHLQLRLDMPDEKAALRERLLASQDAVIQSVGWQQVAVESCDAGNWESAWQAFTRAQRLNPQDRSLAHLELLLLLCQGRREEAVARLEFWRQQLLRDGGERSHSLIALLDSMVHEGPGSDALMAIVEPQMLELKLLLEQTEPQCLYRLRRSVREGAELLPTRELERADQRACAGGYWLEDESLEEWLCLLQDHPLMLQSFELLHQLEMHLFDLQDHVPAAASIHRQLLSYSSRLRRCVLESLQAGDIEFAAQREGNLALLELAAAEMACLAETDMPAALDVGRWLLRADPEDGADVAELMLHYLIRAGEPAEAIELAGRCSRKLPFVCYGHALALFATGQHEQSLQVLLDATASFPKLWQALLCEPEKVPDWAGPVRPGSSNEAWLYRDCYLGDWQSSGALEWASQRLTRTGSLRKRQPRA